MQQLGAVSWQAGRAESDVQLQQGWRVLALQPRRTTRGQQEHRKLWQGSRPRLKRPFQLRLM